MKDENFGLVAGLPFYIGRMFVELVGCCVVGLLSWFCYCWLWRSHGLAQDTRDGSAESDDQEKYLSDALRNIFDEKDLLDTELLNVSNRSEVLLDSSQYCIATLNEKPSTIEEQQATIDIDKNNSCQDSSQRKNESAFSETCITEQKTGLEKIFDQNHEQFIKGEWKNGSLVKLHYAQFKTGNSNYMRLYAPDNLFTNSINNCVARIVIRSFSIRSRCFKYIRKELESKIEIIKILDDNSQNKLETSREKLKAILKLKQEELTISSIAQRDLFQLFLSINKISKFFKLSVDKENIKLLLDILNNKLFSQEFLNTVKVVYEDENKYICLYNNRNFGSLIMNQIKNEFSWKKCISEYIKNSTTSLKTALINALPTQAIIASGLTDINKLSDHQLFTCNVHDVQLFSDLELSIQQHEKISVKKFHDFTHDYVNKLWKLFITNINANNDTPVLTNAVFLQLFKTFLELQNFVCEARNEDIISVVTMSDTDLRFIENTKNISNIHENRLKFIMSLMNHFKPADVKKSEFNYQFSFFKEKENILIRFKGFVVNMFNTSISDIAQEYVIWVHYIHKNFTELIDQKNKNSNRSELNSFLNALMKLFIIALRNKEVTLEKVRILADSLIKFSTTISPYFLEQSFVNENELNLLSQQIEYLKTFSTAYDQTVNDITNIVDIYQVFWDERQTFFTELQEKYSLWPSALNKLIEKCNTFIRFVFNLKIYSNRFLILLKSYNEFIRLLRATDFPWYIEKQNICSEAFVKLVDQHTNSYLVEDTKHFIQEYLNKSRNQPQHFLFNLAKNLINCVQEFLNQSDWEERDKMYAASDLLLLMGRSLINFNKLPNAVDFQNFYAKFTEPFKRVTQKFSDINNFKRRLGSLENYYKYTIELNVMGVVKALELCKQKYFLSSTSISMIDYTFNIDKLHLCYNVYLDKFNDYVENYILKSDFNVDQFAKKIISETKPLDISKWDSEYKILKLPEQLASLSAVWSALESEDVVSQKQVIKPHCIQILCVLRLLAADKECCGVDSHLAQVLTGQGKSIILSLLAAILALTGNRVGIVCYNKYLANRDQNDFKLFYSTLKIQDQINYGTFDTMAEEILNPDINGTKYSLRKFVNDLIIDELPRLHVTEEEHGVSRTVLLIDEVDLFFSTAYYGNVYSPCIIIGSETIAKLQIKIWYLTSINNNISDINNIVQKYIDEIFPQCTDKTFVKIVRNSRAVLNSQIEEMILNAKKVRNISSGEWYLLNKFKLRDDGLIIFINDDGEHVTTIYSSYYNVFIYFKLKKDNFEHKIFQNYGYLLVNCGSVSYALLPIGYNSILGVTGTLKQLSDVEMRAVTSYNILRGSDMPTFFGSSKLRVTNFTIKSIEAEWIKAILDSILSIVEEGRAVIVFFKDEYTIDLVRDKFASHLSRYSVLTGNESAEEVANCVEEAGVARKITIATQHMGRGVDFKSNDSAVETKGGVHVIQTFWCEDVKEETQIKGRTARKDNNGSYEAVLCSEHLVEAGYQDFALSYSALSDARAQRARDKGTELALKIVNSKQKHDETMKFLKSFFNYNPDNRQEYLYKYPVVNV